MHKLRGRRRAVVILVSLALVLAAALTARADFSGSQRALPWGPSEFAAESGKSFETSSQGVENGGSGGESAEALIAAQQWQQARTAPGIVAPGAYSSAFSELTGLTATAGSWTDVTRVKYDADDIQYETITRTRAAARASS